MRALGVVRALRRLHFQGGRPAAVSAAASAAAAVAAAAGRNCLFCFLRACVCVRTLTCHPFVALLLPLLLLLLLPV